MERQFPNLLKPLSSLLNRDHIQSLVSLYLICHLGIILSSFAGMCPLFSGTEPTVFSFYHLTANTPNADVYVYEECSYVPIYIPSFLSSYLSKILRTE